MEEAPGDRYRTLRELAQDAIVADIMAGRLRPGQKLIETDLVTKYGISRGPIREAMRALEGQGLLKATSNRGCVVSSLTRQEIIENYEIRIELEGLAARLATPLLSAADFDQLDSLLCQMNTAAEPDDWLHLNQAFHLAIYSASRRPQLIAMTRDLMEAVHPYIRLFVSDPGHLRDTHSDHEPLLAALRARNADSAEQITQDHLRRAGAIVARLVAEDDDPSGLGSAT
jgi:DNA-binding GntR family transcriptional regulator